ERHRFAEDVAIDLESHDRALSLWSLILPQAVAARCWGNGGRPGMSVIFITSVETVDNCLSIRRNLRNDSGVRCRWIVESRAGRHRIPQLSTTSAQCVQSLSGGPAALPDAAGELGDLVVDRAPLLHQLRDLLVRVHDG